MDPECAQLFVQRPPFHPGLRKPTCPSHYNVSLHAQPDENIQTRSQVLDDQVWPLKLKCIKVSLITYLEGIRAQVKKDTLILTFKGQQLQGSTVKLFAKMKVSISL